MTDTVTVKLFSTLGRFAQGGKTQFPLAWHPGMQAQDILDLLKIPATAERVILVNSRHREADHLLCPDDIVTLFPPMTGG